MKLHFPILISSILIVSVNQTYSQEEEEKYISKEEVEYYNSLRKTWDSNKFEPVSIETVKKVPFEFIKLIKVEKPAYTYFEENSHVFVDSITKQVIKAKIGIDSDDIVKQEKKDNLWAIIYTSSKYDDFIFGGWGYWLALSYDGGETWKKYYTGLSENCYYYFKRNSKISLWKDSITLQIESLIVRQITEVYHPGSALFEKVQDSMAVQLNIPKIILDSDNDDLTDIEESKMMLNPFDSDTDDDGISDSIDKNPRFKSVKSKKATIYEALIENRKGEIDLNNPYVPKENDSIERDLNYTIFVTDDPELQGLNLYFKPIIIMSVKEYNVYKLQYPYHFIKCNYTKMFKCDNLKDTYKIIETSFTGGSTFIVQKTKKGWKIFMVSSWIS